MNTHSYLGPRRVIALTAVALSLNFQPAAAAEREDQPSDRPEPHGVVKSLNGLEGRVHLRAGSNITITPSGNGLRISALGTVATGVQTLNGLTGDVSLRAGANITLAPGTNGITIAAPLLDRGVNNTNDSWVATISGGQHNSIAMNSEGSVIAGGSRNLIAAWSPSAAIGGGRDNSIRINSMQSTIGGGYYNQIQFDAEVSTIAGGLANTIEQYALLGTIGGGARNTVASSGSVIGGGDSNTIQNGAMASVVGGGVVNTIESAAIWGTIAGGGYNWVRGSFGAVPGGYSNEAGTNGFAAGTRAKANHTGSFVWGDSTDADVTSTADNQFTVRASGGAVFYTSADLTSGVQLPAGGGAWAALSDRAHKENVRPVDPREVLDKLCGLPLATWNYRSQDKSIRHLGPMAQDFHAAFQLGEDEKHITTVDADGVALAAIQGLNALLKEKDARISELEQRLAAIETIMGGQTSVPATSDKKIQSS